MGGLEKPYFGPDNHNPYPKTYPQNQNIPQNPKPISSYQPSHQPHPNPNPNPYLLPKPKRESGRYLSEREMREKRTKGLCFKCDEPWSLSHVCRNREMRIILIEDDDVIGEGERGPIESSPVFEHEDPMAGISLQSLIGFTSPKTMKLEGEIDGTRVLVLIDSGATSNFISTPLVHKLGKTISACTTFGVTLGTDLKVYGEAVCKGISLELQGITILDEFFALELGSLDVILGVQL